MKKFIFLLAAAAILCLPARAAELSEELGTGKPEQVLPAEIRELANTDREEAAKRFAQAAGKILPRAISDACSTAGLMLTVVFICSVVRSGDISGRSVELVQLAGVAAIGAAAVSDVNSYLTSAVEALETLQDYSRVLMPVLAGASAATGAVSSSAAKCAATTVVMDLLLTLSRRVVLPAVCGHAALCVSNAALGNDTLRMAARLMKKVCTLLLTGLTFTFVLWLTLISSVLGTADAASARAAKTVISSVLPVVGHVLSGAADTLSAAAAGVRATTGIAGLIAVLAVCLSPAVSLGVRYIAYKLTAALCACLDSGTIAGLLDGIGGCFGMLLGLTGVGGAVVFISVTSFVRALF